MAFKKVLKKGLFSGLNPIRWIGYEQISSNAKTIKNIASGLVKKTSTKDAALPPPSTFEEAMQRYGLTEADLKKRLRASLQIAILCALLSVFMMAYAIYLFMKPFPLAGFVCVILTLLLWAYAFREHFNYFQMKQRRLGCTFKQWLAWLIKGSK